MHYDVIIIGTGAGGGTLAHRLAPSGKRILLLERGGWLPRERQNWDSRAVVVEGRYNADDTWLDRRGKPFAPSTHYCVGGNTRFYGAALFRFRERDFNDVRHFGGVSPAWPIRYEDLAPYYTQAERLYEVHGERGVDPTEPPADSDYPFPAVSHEPRIQQLHDDLAAAGLRPFHVPLGVRLDEKRIHSSLCVRCGTCDGFPCLINAKSDAQSMCVVPALRHPNVSILTGARAIRLVAKPSGREVSRVVVEHDGHTLELSADVFVVSCGAVNSAALLLRSATAEHPQGLANGSGAVGRHYMCHNNSVLLAISRHPNPTVFQKTIAVNDYYFGADDSPFPLGHISMVGKFDKEILAAGAPPLTPKWVLEKMATHSLDFWLTSEDLPDPDNRVTLADDGRIQLSYTPNNTEAHDRLIRKLKGLLDRIGCEEHTWFDHLYLGKKIPLAGVAHQCGTVRFGDDPATSALDVNCRAHELDNLYVVDASFFVSSTAVNPALTIMANALRVGDHLLERLGAARMQAASV
jgi:choline dehydrogenase-like flavoprotein